MSGGIYPPYFLFHIHPPAKLVNLKLEEFNNMKDKEYLEHLNIRDNLKRISIIKMYRYENKVLCRLTRSEIISKSICVTCHFNPNFPSKVCHFLCKYDHSYFRFISLFIYSLIKNHGLQDCKE